MHLDSSHKVHILEDTWTIWRQSKLFNTSGAALQSEIWNLILEQELDFVFKAYKFSKLGYFRDIKNLDTSYKKVVQDQEFLEISTKAATQQLLILSPLKDHKVITQYIQQVKQGGCSGIQAITYGILFEIYSIPLREALLFYADQFRKVNPGLFQPLDVWNLRLKSSIASLIKNSTIMISRDNRSI